MDKIDQIIYDQVGSITSIDINLLEEILDYIAHKHLRHTRDTYRLDFDGCHKREKLKVIYILLYLMESGVLDDHPIGGHFRIN